MACIQDRRKEHKCTLTIQWTRPFPGSAALLTKPARRAQAPPDKKNWRLVKHDLESMLTNRS